MAKLAERSWIKKVTPVAPENLVGDLIQAVHPLFGLVWINRDRVSGTPCFYGTRVPIKTLSDSLAAGSNSFLTTSRGFRGSRRKRYLNWRDLTYLTIFRNREFASSLER